MIRDDTGYLLVWLLAVLVFFSAFTQKRSVYILSAYPAFALQFGAWFHKLNGTQSPPGRFFARAAGYLNAAVFVA